MVTAFLYDLTREGSIAYEARMLQNLDDQVWDCLQRAAECAELAEATDQKPHERREWLSLHDRYLTIVTGIERRDRQRIR